MERGLRRIAGPLPRLPVGLNDRKPPAHRANGLRDPLLRLARYSSIEGEESGSS